MKKRSDELAVFEDAVSKATSLELEVRNLANFIAFKMAEFDGGRYRVVIDHQAGLVMVRPE